MGIFGEDRVYPEQVPGPKEILNPQRSKMKKAVIPERPDCCELVAIMRGAMDDEVEGRELYVNIARDLEKFKGKDPIMNYFKEIVDDISKDEERHHRYLKAMSSALGDFCKCE